ncbi:MAG: sigma-70 family RNA polymerase sigma factor [Planctomycetes bacterium]|nr:sigma-70 family RNA polymerase sigma factor [Planctomycetota bacterium]
MPTRPSARGAATGAPEDLARVFDRLAPRLLLLAAHVAGERAEDLVQATFLRAIEIADRHDGQRPILPWLSGILVLEAKKLRRREGRRPDPERLDPARFDPLEAAGVDPADEAAAAELRDTLVEALGALPDDYAQVLTLRLVHGLTPTEIAHALRIPRETVRTRLRRGGDLLRRRLPAGLAVVLATVGVLVPGRALAEVRDAVLARAADLAPLAPAPRPASPAPAPAPLAPVATTARRAWLLGAVGAAVVATSVALWPDPTPVPPPERTPVRRSVEEPVPMRRTIASEAPGPADVAEPAAPVANPFLASLTGTFVDDRGFDVAGVHVELFALDGALLATPAAALPARLDGLSTRVGEASTDTGGRFLIEGLHPRGLLVMRAAPPVGAPQTVPIVRLIRQRPEPGQRIELGEIELRREKLALGRVVDPRGRPIRGARLAVPLDREGLDTSAALGDLAPLVDAALEPQLGDGDRVAVGCGAGATVLDLPPWLRELAGALRRPPVVTAPDGTFGWPTVGAAEVELAVEADGFLPVTAVMQAADPAIRNDDVVLEPLPRVEVAVVDVRGRPVADAELMVGARPDERGAARLRPAGRTDPDGFVHVAARDDVSLTVAVRTGAGAPWHVAVLPPEPGRALRLPAPGALQLRTVDPVGASVAEPVCQLVPGALEPRALALAWQLGAIEPIALHRADDGATDDVGVVTVDQLPGGPYLAFVTAPARATRAVGVDVVGGALQRRTVELAPRDELAVDLLDVGFRALEGALVAVVPSRSEPFAAVLPVDPGRPDAEGRVLVPRARFEPLRIDALTDALGGNSAEVRDSAETQQIVHRGPAAIDGRLLLHREGMDPCRWLAVARRPLDLAQSARVEPPVVAPVLSDRSFAMPVVEPGTWLVHAVVLDDKASFGPAALARLLFPAELDPAPVVVEVRAGGRAQVLLEPLPAVEPAPLPVAERAVRGRLLLDGAAPAAGRALWLTLAGRPPVALALGPDGSFRGEGEVDGEFTLELCARGAPPGGSPWWRGRFAAEQADEPLEIALATAPFSASVLGAGDRERAAGAWVELSGDVDAACGGRTRLVATADARGFAALDAVPAGDLRLRVLHPDRGWLDQRLRVGAEVATGIALELRPLLDVAGQLDGAVLGEPELAPGTRVELVRVSHDDGPELARRGTADLGLQFTVGGLLPGRYRVLVHVARRFRQPDGAVVVVAPEVTRTVIECREIVVGRGAHRGFVPRRG